ncbi:chromate transporter [Cytobacillus horneckiae]|uniref:ChrA protein n=1 Tax=Cytobacillus horneckiae TaxID=549687 RepID=A0A2N0ZJ02_9BACI|nr:chromate transporter [Cytobacillus horneckiae]MBN6884880.1 chromate transporter [Cytobacillus horneckiae]MEC1158977.1 chromate transporter [Cytobacillus horneckiae]MED2937931.1 chromate transporter [Cytobacillus horneckiae]PKG29502.1 ChrA protein [Cytobacillus horneckiae]
MQKPNKNVLQSLLEIFIVSSKLGLTSFGGPIAHLGYFHNEYIRKRKWMDERSYADLVALCQFLPGPASSQVGIGIGVMRAGVAGGIVSFLGFTLPSVITLILFALLIQGFDIGNAGWIHGLKIVAVAVVAHAIIGMANNLTPDLPRKAIALFALVLTLLWQAAFSQIGVILLSAFIGYLLFKETKEEPHTRVDFPISRRFATVCLGLFFGLLVLLPIMREITSWQWIAMFDSFYRSGSLVFGGGHVVLPLLEREFIPTGWLTEEAFLAGYGATQAVPGPLFTFAAYLGTVINGWTGGLLATTAIFLPAFLLILGTLPFWNILRSHPKVKGALMGVNAAVVGILISAFYHPIWTSSIKEPVDFAFAAILFSMLVYWKLPPWIIVITGAVGGTLLSYL